MKPTKCNFCKSDKFGGHKNDCFILTGKHKTMETKMKTIKVSKVKYEKNRRNRKRLEDIKPFVKSAKDNLLKVSKILDQI